MDSTDGFSASPPNRSPGCGGFEEITWDHPSEYKEIDVHRRHALSGARIQLSRNNEFFPGTSERIIMVSGIIDDVMKLMEDAHYSLSAASLYPYAGLILNGGHGTPLGYTVPSVPYSRANYVPNGVGKYRSNKGMMPPLISTRSSPGGSEGEGISVTIGVADEHIGFVLGRGGRTIMEIIQISGARIKISDRNDFMPGTSNRKVTITGSHEAVNAAEDMIRNKVSSISEG
ncbi:uncharacterized protein A4U43_C10F18300 [Asparagus officinalis]|uniref:K Homology domain-containing protein n=1 Tax=Asparagus officinalis TaxID=4686 RepID=A0A5P1E736_ASPOF|nr:uncharacterized protein A4U43_C10F18300 [Asparagus officinalis]